MKLDLDDEDEAFRQDVRAFFAIDYPQHVLDKNRRGVLLTKQDHVEAQRALNSRGWFALNWPKENGGADLSPLRRYVFDEELERAGAPSVIPMGVIYVGPVICAYGSEEQKRTWLPDLLESRTFWAQGYSEPEAGSDLASLKTRAEREGDHYIVNGEKIWTSQAHWADWIFCLVRTSDAGRKQEGISFLCFPMDSPGVKVHPIISIDGSHYLNRVSLENVRVPCSNLVGQEGQGWGYSKFLLENERLSYAHVAQKKQAIRNLRAIASTIDTGEGHKLSNDHAFVRRIAQCEISLIALEQAVLSELMNPGGGADISLLKIHATELAQSIHELERIAAGDQSQVYVDRTLDGWANALPTVPEWAPVATAAYFFTRAQTIYGGATEVQKNIIARRMIGPL